MFLSQKFTKTSGFLRKFNNVDCAIILSTTPCQSSSSRSIIRECAASDGAYILSKRTHILRRRMWVCSQTHASQLHAFHIKWRMYIAKKKKKRFVRGISLMKIWPRAQQEQKNTKIHERENEETPWRAVHAQSRGRRAASHECGLNN